MFTAARTEILEKAAQQNNENVNRFVQYIITNWINNPRLTSTYGVADRTNNPVESFNRRATARLGGQRPNVWIFLGNKKSKQAWRANDLRCQEVILTLI